jgi:hypothetical protein
MSINVELPLLRKLIVIKVITLYQLCAIQYQTKGNVHCYRMYIEQ